MLKFLFNKVAHPKTCNFTKNRLQHRYFLYEIGELFKDASFYRTPPVAVSENNEQQQLSEGFVNSCYKIVLPILLQELTNDTAACKHSGGALLLVEDVTSSHSFRN